jgi:hypothetical protein
MDPWGSTRGAPGFEGYPGVVGSPGSTPETPVSVRQLSATTDILMYCVLPRCTLLGFLAGPSGYVL